MRICGDCSAENPDDARFCANCGAGLADTCAECSTPLPDGAAFCPKCGHPVSSETTEERRFLTVLFADMVGFTAGSDEADPEDVQARLIPYHRRLREEIERYDGTVEKLMGDGVMAVFEQPRGAVLAASDVQRRLAYETWGETGPLRCRTAFMSGPPSGEPTTTSDPP